VDLPVPDMPVIKMHRAMSASLNSRRA